MYCRAAINAARWLRVLVGIFTSSIGVHPRLSWASNRGRIFVDKELFWSEPENLNRFIWPKISLFDLLT